GLMRRMMIRLTTRVPSISMKLCVYSCTDSPSRSGGGCGFCSCCGSCCCGCCCCSGCCCCCGAGSSGFWDIVKTNANATVTQTTEPFHYQPYLYYFSNDQVPIGILHIIDH